MVSIVTGVPIQLHVDRTDDQVQTAGELFDRRRISCRGDLVRAEGSRLIELLPARRERRHVAAVRGGELQGHVAESADADDAYSLSRFGVHRDRRKDRYPAAQKGPGFGEVEAVRQREGPRPMRADVTGEAAAMSDDGHLHFRAKVVASRH